MKDTENIVWKDRKRVLGMPISFTKYYIKDGRLFSSKGLFKTVENEVLLYRILDLKYEATLGNKIFRVGTVTLYTRDETDKELKLEKIKNPKKVRDLLSKMVEEARNKVKVTGREMYGASRHIDDYDDNNDDNNDVDDNNDDR